jgi:hypothetical protein
MQTPGLKITSRHCAQRTQGTGGEKSTSEEQILAGKNNAPSVVKILRCANCPQNLLDRKPHAFSMIPPVTKLAMAR